MACICTQIFEFILVRIALFYANLKKLVQPILVHYGKRFDNVDIIIISFILPFIIVFVFSILRGLYKQGWSHFINYWIRRVVSIGFISRRIETVVKKELASVEREWMAPIENPTFEIPEKPMRLEKLQERLQYLGKEEINSGKLSGCLYAREDSKITDMAKDYAREFVYANMLHFDLFASARQMEAEIVSCVLRMFNGHLIDATGSYTTGGTESILMAMVCYRDWGYYMKGITEPEVILPITGHAAFDKAAHYFKIKLVHIPIDPVTFKGRYEDYAKNINSNTVALVGSCPNYPNGTVDPIEDIAALAKRNGIGCHVDCCLGSFLVPYLEDIQVDIGTKFDFRVPGVTSISCDPHKFGLGPKGCSVVLYRTKQLKRYQYFKCTQWPGGVYATTLMEGSRPASSIAGTWAALMGTGKEGYREQARKLTGAVAKVRAAIEKLDDIEVCGDPKICVVSFKSTNPRLKIHKVAGGLKDKHWHVAAVQRPDAVHFCFTSANVDNADQLIKDITTVVQEVREGKGRYETMGKVYGLTQTFPDSLINDGLDYVLDLETKLKKDQI